MALTPVEVVVDSRLRFPAELPPLLRRELERCCTHDNPDFHRRKRLGLSTWGSSPRDCTWLDDGGFSLPRGALRRAREVASQVGYHLLLRDQRLRLPPVDFPALRRELRPHQRAVVEACLRREQGIVRSPTGSGKTTAALAVVAAARQPALAVMRDGNLLQQWRDRAIAELGLEPREVGVLQGSKRATVGARLTLALQQTLWSRRFPLAEVARCFGVVLVDEAQGVASSTYQRVVDAFPAAYRLGFSADESRKDRKEYLTYDYLGEVLVDVSRAELEAAGVVEPVVVRLVPTEFRADWYQRAQPGERDFQALLDRLTTDEARNKLVLDVLRGLVAEGEVPALAFSHRVEHARLVADVLAFGAGLRCGLLLGGDDSRVRFNEDKGKLLSGELPLAVGTYQAVGQGIDLPAVRAGVCLTPIGGNRQFFGQVRGRICRAKGGLSSRLYYLWDRHVWPGLPRQLAAWNDGLVEVEDEGGWRRLERSRPAELAG